MIGVAFAVASGSDAMLLDGVCSPVGFGMAWVAARIALVLLAPATVHLPFGKAALEPVVNIARSGVILLVLVYAAASALGALSGGVAPARAGPAVVYGVLIGLAGLAVARRQSDLARSSSSALLAVDATACRADGAISLSVDAAFVVALVLSWLDLEVALPYVDPIAALMLVAYLVREPWRELRHALGELVVEAHPVELQDEVVTAVARATAGLKHLDQELELWKLGRHLTVRLSLRMDDPSATFSIGQLDEIRSRLRSEIEGVAPAIRVDVLFMADRRWLDARPAERSDLAPRAGVGAARPGAPPPGSPADLG